MAGAVFGVVVIWSVVVIGQTSFSIVVLLLFGLRKSEVLVSICAQFSGAFQYARRVFRAALPTNYLTDAC